MSQQPGRGFWGHDRGCRRQVIFASLVLTWFFAAVPAFAQDQPSVNDIITQMQHDLNLSDDQVASITQVVESYVSASTDLQKSIDDGTINPSAIDSQKQQLKAVEYQGIAQYLRPDQLTQWNYMQGQDQGNEDAGEEEAGEAQNSH